jgi:hypothetical protein
MNRRCGLDLVLLIVNVALAGCGGARPVAGGSAGALHAGDVMLCDIQVTIHQMDGGSSRVVGFGVSGPDGRFALVQNGAKGPLWLSPGEYRCTVESVGSVPVRFPKEYAKAETTPLKISWTSDKHQLDLDVPAPLASR